LLEVYGYKEPLTDVQTQFCRPTLCHPVAGAVKAHQFINAVLERAKTKNTSYHMLLNRSKSGSCINKGVMFKVRHSSIGNNDFTIIRPITAERQLAQQTHAAPRKSLWHFGESCCLQNVIKLY